MKRTFILLFAFACVKLIQPANGQFTDPNRARVTLSNTDAGAIFLNENGNLVPAPKDGTFVEVFARPADTDLEFLSVSYTQSGESESVFGLVVPGYFSCCLSRALPRFEGQQEGEFFVRAWRGAPTWVQAQMNLDAFIGQSAIFRNETEFFGAPGAPTLHNMPSFTLEPVPEPSTIALGTLALLTMFAFMRRAKARR